MAAPPKRRPAGGRRSVARSRASEGDLILFCTVFATLTSAIALLDATNSIKLILLTAAALLALALVQVVRQRSILEVARNASPRARLLLLLALLTILILFLGARPAAEHFGLVPEPRGPPSGSSSPPAFVRYHVTSAVTLRAGPGVQYPPVQEIGAGTPVDVTCQAHGAMFGGSTVWNRLTGGQWVPDAMTDSANHGRDALSPPFRWC